MQLEQNVSKEDSEIAKLFIQCFQSVFSQKDYQA